MLCLLGPRVAAADDARTHLAALEAIAGDVETGDAWSSRAVHCGWRATRAPWVLCTWLDAGDENGGGTTAGVVAAIARLDTGQVSTRKLRNGDWELRPPYLRALHSDLVRGGEWTPIEVEAIQFTESDEAASVGSVELAWSGRQVPLVKRGDMQETTVAIDLRFTSGETTQTVALETGATRDDRSDAAARVVVLEADDALVAGVVTNPWDQWRTYGVRVVSMTAAEGPDLELGSCPPDTCPLGYRSEIAPLLDRFCRETPHPNDPLLLRRAWRTGAIERSGVALLDNAWAAMSGHEFTTERLARFYYAEGHDGTSEWLPPACREAFAEDAVRDPDEMPPGIETVRWRYKTLFDDVKATERGGYSLGDPEPMHGGMP